MKKDKKYFSTFLFVIVILSSLLYALPNFYNKQPSVVVISKNNESFNIENIKNKITIYNNFKLSEDKKELIFPFNNIEEQMKGYEEIKEKFENNNYYINLNLKSTAPNWLSKIHSKSVSLGLDLMGGVHFLMEVDVEHIKNNIIENSNTDIIKNTNSDYKISDNKIIYPLKEETLSFLKENYSDIFDIQQDNNYITLSLNETFLNNSIDSAVKQNIFTLKNRVNEIGVAEPIIQKEGKNRIIIQLPGIQDTQKARDLIGTTASLYFKETKKSFNPNNSEKIKDLEGNEYIFSKDNIITGESIIDAISGINPENNQILVSVTLNSAGGNKMLEYTSNNVGKSMGSILVETSYETKIDDNNNEYKNKIVTKKAINVATIQGVFSNRFQITGIKDKEEAHNLAILLRSGSLVAPVDIIEERTIGPNLGAENIKNGQIAISLGFIFVIILMVIKYRIFGAIASFCVGINLLMLLSFLSMIGATLTLPGIAGILLTVGMAVDGNIIIFERIREEYKNKNSLSIAINNGYEKALSSILDANITTLIAGFVLFYFGSGAIKGFAVTLSLGIFTSLITSLYLSKFLIYLFYKNKQELTSKDILI